MVVRATEAAATAGRRHSAPADDLPLGLGVPLDDIAEPVGRIGDDAGLHPTDLLANRIEVGGVIEGQARYLLGKEALEVGIELGALLLVGRPARAVEQVVGAAVGEAGDIQPVRRELAGMPERIGIWVEAVEVPAIERQLV